MAAATVSREEILRFRLRQHQLDRPPRAATRSTDVALLDYGLQDTGADGATWALEIRGAPSAAAEDLAWAWTWRGAPHAYRRSDLANVAVATAPFSEADAAKRIFDAVKPLRAVGIGALEALRVVAGHLRDTVTAPTVKGDASGRLTALLDPAYLRECRSCRATHVYEMLFRLPPLQAGLEIEPGTSPPVLRRVPHHRPQMYGSLGGEADVRFHAVRNYLRFYGPARARDVAQFLDAPLRDVQAQWPPDAIEVGVTDTGAGMRRQPSFVLAEDVQALADAGAATRTGTLRVLGPFDPYLQVRDRELVVPDEARRKDLWPVLGRPGAVVVDGEVVGTWRPRASAKRLTMLIQLWRPLRAAESTALQEQAERLAAHRGTVLATVSEG